MGEERDGEPGGMGCLAPGVEGAAPAAGADLVGGRGALDAAETERLLEWVLGNGGRRLLGRLDRLDLEQLSRWEPARLQREAGLGPVSARSLAAAFALGRRVEGLRWVRSDSIRSPGGVYRLMAPRLRGREREVFSVLLVDGKHRLLAIEEVSEGTLTSSLVHPREVFRPALRRGAAALVAVHNHPSGDPEPSAEDLEVTRRLLDAGRLLGVPLLDHVVLGRGAFVSLRERMAF